MDKKAETPLEHIVRIALIVIVFIAIYFAVRKILGQ